LNRLWLIGCETKRVVLTRQYLYVMALLLLFISTLLGRALSYGSFGTAPFSQVSYSAYLTGLCPLLLSILALLCAPVFSGREVAARRILLAAPVSLATVLGIRACGVLLAFSGVVLIPVIYSLAFYAWQFRFYEFGSLLHPAAVFLGAPTLFVFGLAMALGRSSSKLVYGLIPLLMFTGIFNLNLPVWLDVSANNFMVDYPREVIRVTGSAEMVYQLPSPFLWSRLFLATTGILLLGYACWKPWR